MATTKAAATIISRGTNNAAFTQLTGCSATRSGTTATLTKTSHGLSNGDKVLIQGFALEEFNGIFTVANATTNAFDYTIKQDPGANPSGTPGTVDKVTLGTALNMSTDYGGFAIIGLQNGTTGPTVAPQIWMGVANANNEYDYIWSLVTSGDSTANSFNVLRMALDAGISYINFAVCRNTAQAVDCFVEANHITAG